MKNYSHIVYALALGATFAGYAFAVFAQAGGAASGGATGGAGGSTGSSMSGSGTAGMTTSGTAGSTSGITGMTSGTTGTAGTTSGSTAIRSTGTTSMSPGSPSAPLGPTTWNTDNQFWQNNFTSRPYAGNNSYSTYRPAYQFGFNAYNQFSGRPYQDLNQAQLKSQWERTRGTSNLSWEQAQTAARDEYERLYNNRTAGMSNTTPSAGRTVP